MKIKERSRYIILLIAFVLILRVLSFSIAPNKGYDTETRCPPMSTAEQISFIEIDKFLKDWVEYVEKGYYEKVSEKISLRDGDIEDNLPMSVKLWFDMKCWKAERFFYIEDRLKASINTLYLRRHSASILAILNERITSENESEYQNIIDMQKKIANIENISDEELKIVEMREAEIAKILNTK